MWFPDALFLLVLPGEISKKSTRSACLAFSQEASTTKALASQIPASTPTW